MARSAILIGNFVRRVRDLDMPRTEPIAPPAKPKESPAPEQAPPERKLDPFNPDWPATRPTPEPKASSLL
jgi:hypothetical protein